MPLVSVVIPAYNRAHVLPRALRSVAAQTWSDYEVIVVDDGSRDGTDDVVTSIADVFDGRLRYVRNDRNQGAPSARNAAIRLARGAYIALLDADDEWLPEKLSTQVDYFKSAPERVGLATTAYILVDRSGVSQSQHPPDPKDGNLSESIVEIIEGTAEIVGVFSTLMCRREVFESVGGLDESLACWEDADFYLRAARQFHFGFISKSLTVKHESHDSISYNWSAEGPGVRTFWRKHLNEFGRRPAVRRYIARHQHAVGIQACLAGDLRNGRQLFLESLAIRPLQWHPAVHLAMSLTGAKAYSAIWLMRERARRWSRPASHFEARA